MPRSELQPNVINLNVTVDRLPADVHIHLSQAAAGKSSHGTSRFDTLPSSDNRPLLNKGQIKKIIEVRRSSRRALSSRTNLEGIRESEDPTGDSLASERAGSPIIGEAITQGQFESEVGEAKGMNIPDFWIEEAVRVSRLGISETGRELATEEAELMMGEISDIEPDYDRAPVMDYELNDS